jgi:hypothetical protein
MVRMRRVVAGLASALALVVALTGCVSAPPPASSAVEPDLRGDWQLMLMKDGRGAVDTSVKFMTLTIGNTRETQTSTPCGTAGATVRGGVGAIWIQAKSGPSDYCGDDPQVNLNVRYIRALNRTAVATLGVNRLILSSHGSRLEFARPKPSPAIAAEGKQWTLQTVAVVLGSSHAVQTFGGYASVRVKSPTSLLIDTKCATNDANFTVEGGQFSLINSRGASSTCTKEENGLEELLTTFFFQKPFRMVVADRRMTLESVDDGTTLYFLSGK